MRVIKGLQIWKLIVNVGMIILFSNHLDIFNEDFRWYLMSHTFFANGLNYMQAYNGSATFANCQHVIIVKINNSLKC